MSSHSIQPNHSSISLPPISSMDSYRHQPAYAPADYHQQPSRHLPAPYPVMSATPRHDGLPTRPIYPGGVPAYQMPAARVALPPSSDPNLMIAGRAHKTKEVKRRTKTGCMTCRKRRIKCDEGRPACKNCQKSKRECLGYDPGFQGPPGGQPALQSAPTSNPASASSGSSNSHAHPYANQQPSSPSVSSQTASVITDNSIDPSDYSQSHHYRPAYDMDTAQNYTFDRLSIRKATPQSIDALCTISHHARPVLPPLPSDPPNLDALQIVYTTGFAPGLDNFFETRWYRQHGFEQLVADRDLLAQFLAYITFVHNNQQGNSSYEAVASQEARIVLGLLALAASRADQDPEARRIASSLEALQSLLTGTTPLPSNCITSPSHSTATSTLEKQLEQRRLAFWACFIHFVIQLHTQDQQSDSDPTLDTKTLETDLETCRSHLDNLENRDLVYSVMVMMYLSKREELNLNITYYQEGESGVDDTDECRRKRAADWKTALVFLRQEASGRATNLVCSTVAGVALRAWEWDD